MADRDTITALVDSLPTFDQTWKAPPRATYETAYDKVLADGADAVAVVIDLISEVDNGEDYKARKLLHNLAVYTSQPAKIKQRPIVAESLAKALGEDRPWPVKRYLIQTLQVCAAKEQSAAIARFLNDENLYDYSARALLAINDGVAPHFRAALPKSEGRARVTIVQALGVLCDSESAGAIGKLVGDDDAELGQTAVWALANMNDASAVDTVIKAIGKADGFARYQLVDAGLQLAERLVEANKKADAARIYAHLATADAFERHAHIRDAAKRGLETVR